MTRTVARRRGRRDASSYPIKPIMMIVSMETYLAADLSVQPASPSAYLIQACKQTK